MALTLIDEPSERRRKAREPKPRTGRSMPQFHKKGHPANEGQRVIVAEKTEEVPQLPPDPGPSKQPSSPKAPDVPRRSRQGDLKALEGVSQSAPVAVHKPRPPRLQRTGKLREKGKEIDRGTPGPPPDWPPPPIPARDPIAAENPIVPPAQAHKPIGIRPAGSTDDIATLPRSTSHSHVRNRHAPLGKPTMLQRLSTTFEQPTDKLMLDAGHPDDHGPRRVQDTVSGSRVLRDKDNSVSPTPAGIVRETHSISELPMTWKYAVGTPSSLEQALDDVVRKLDDVEPALPGPRDSTRTAQDKGKCTASEEDKARTRTGKLSQEPSPKQDNLPGQYSPEPRSSPQKPLANACADVDEAFHEADARFHDLAAEATVPPGSKLERTQAVRRQRKRDDLKRDREPEAVVPAESTTTIPTSSKSPAPPQPKKNIEAPSLRVEDRTVDHRDRDISDRDVLKGLKLAVSAACDEQLDYWIREKTGLRLRRFLADLRTFEGLDVLEAKSGNKPGKEAETKVDEAKGGKRVEKKTGPRTGRDGAADDETAELGDDEDSPDDLKGRRRRARKRKMMVDRKFRERRREVTGW